MMETEINLPFITAGASGPIHLAGKVDAHAARAIDGRFAGPLDEAGATGARRREAFGPNDIQEVVLVGGSIRSSRRYSNLCATSSAGKSPTRA